MRANPILTLSMAAGVLVLPVTAGAIGLGRLTVQSSIGQPLSARIEISAATPQELDSLAVKIADPTLYRQNNLAYNSVLGRARISLERGSGGDFYLKVVTMGAVNEPYLDLMVEVNWTSGRLVRDYTFLLDPPGVLSAPVEPVAPVRVGAAPARVSAAASAAPSVSGAAAAPAPRAGATGGETYQVQRGDTLSKIAADYKPPSVTLEQMLVALFNTNQGAFDGNNVNRLRAGSIVNIPTAEVAAATAPQEAAQIVRLQASEWRSYRDRVAATAPTSAGEDTRSATGRIGAAVVETPPLAPPGRDQLKVSREAGRGKQVGGATEDIVARERQIREAQVRIAELEKTLNELKRAVELKNQSMAQMQAQADAVKPPPAKAPELKVAESARTEPPKAEEAPKVVEPPKAAEAPKAAEPAKTAEPAPAAEPPKVAEAPKPAPKAPAGPKPQPSFLDTLAANTPTWAIGGGALAVLAGLAAILLARRRRTSAFENSIADDSDIKTKTVFGSTGGGVVNTGEHSIGGDLSRDGLGAIDADEVDPIAEAEVYLAYGRDAQAEEILRHALHKDPQRQEIYVKLLEIQAQHNKPSAFEAVAAELFTVSGGKGEAWHKAAALGRQLDPKNPLFANEGQAAATTRPSVAAPAAGLAAGAVAETIFDARLDDDLAISTGSPARSPLMPSAPEAPRGEPGAAVPSAASTDLAADVQAAAGGRIDLARAGADLEFELDRAAKPAPFGPSMTLEPPAAQPSSPAGAPELDLDTFGLTFDGASEPESASTGSAVSGQWHDAATKLDLAKAYQEMGDVEGAREILQEVLREGDDQQKAEAAALVAKLG